MMPTVFHRYRREKKTYAVLALFCVVVVSCALVVSGRLVSGVQAAEECQSDTTHLPIATQCLEGNLIKVFSYRQDNQCKLFYEPSVGECVLPTPTPTDIPTPTLTIPTATNIPTPTSTPTDIPTPTDTPTPTPTDTPTPTLVPTDIPTLIPTATLVPSPVPQSNPTVALALELTGVGGNQTLIHPQRTVTLDVFDTQNQLVATPHGLITYDPTAGVFTGLIDMGNLPTGTYLIKAKTDRYLKKQLPGIISLTQGQTTTITQAPLVVGDSNGDNAVNIQDWQALFNCYGEKQQTETCLYKETTDLDDDGDVDGVDLNLILRTFAGRNGE